MTTPPASSAPDPRPGRAVFAVVVLVVAAGLVYLALAPQHWLRGLMVVAGGIIVAGLARVVLPDRRSGPLLVRGRWIDAGSFLVAGGLMVVFGLLVR